MLSLTAVNNSTNSDLESASFWTKELSREQTVVDSATTTEEVEGLGLAADAADTTEGDLEDCTKRFNKVTFASPLTLWICLAP